MDSFNSLDEPGMVSELCSVGIPACRQAGTADDIYPPSVNEGPTDWAQFFNRLGRYRKVEIVFPQKVEINQ